MRRLALALLLVACDDESFGPTIKEPATVVDLPFVPEGHGVGVGTGFSSKGSVSTVVSSVNIPARYAVVFECHHGRFVVQGQDDEHRALWGRFKLGQPVWVIYREVYDGSAAPDATRPVVDLDFIDARPR